MTAQLLIYESAVPLSATRHRDSAVEIGGSYQFSSAINSVPLMAVEFPHAASEYAIIFTGPPESLMPAVILGVRDNENLYLSKGGKWEAKYIPAFVRRYPFVFSKSADNQRFVLCVDEAFSGFNREGRGQKLFSTDEKPTPYVESILKFLQDYQAQFNRTQAFCNKVRELDLLEPMQAQVDLGGKKFSLTGFMAVNRAKLKAVPAEKLAELAKTDELELLYLHLQSMRNFSGLPGRLAAMEEDKAGAEPEVESGLEAESKRNSSKRPAGRREPRGQMKDS
jgi:hypothetical protein